MKKSEFLKKAWSFIDTPTKWIRGDYRSGERYCSVGAMGAAYEYFREAGVPEEEIRDAFNLAYRDFTIMVGGSIESWNDHGTPGWQPLKTKWMRVIDRFQQEELAELAPQEVPAGLIQKPVKVEHIKADAVAVPEKERELV